MTTDLPETITVAKAILNEVAAETVVAGHSYIDAEGRWIVQLGLEDPTGDRQIDVVEGDSFEFAGTIWRVAKVYEPTTATRGSVAKLVRVSQPGN